MRVGIHHGSPLSPLLLAIAMDVLPDNVRDFSLMKLLYADDLALYRKSLDDVMERWKVLEGKELRVNVEKTKGNAAIVW